MGEQDEILKQHFLDIAFECGKVSSALGSFYMSKMVKEVYFDSDSLTKLHHLVCFVCGTVRNEKNYSVRLKGKMRLCPSIRKLLNKQTKNPTKIKKWQQRLLHLATNRNNVQVLKCHRCKNTIHQQITSSLSSRDVRKEKTMKKTKMIVTNVSCKKKKKRKERNAGITTPSMKPTGSSISRTTPLSETRKTPLIRADPNTPNWLQELQTPSNTPHKNLQKISLLKAMLATKTSRAPNLTDFLKKRK